MRGDEQFGQRTSARQPNMDRSITPKVTITETTNAMI